MSSVPLAALRLRHPKFEGPLDQYRKVVQLRSLLQGQRLNQQYQQLNQLKLQQAQQAQQDQAKFRQCYMEAEGNPEKTIQLCSRAGVSSQLISQYRDSVTQSKKALEDLDKAGLDNASQRIDILGSAFQSVLSQPENQRAQAYAQSCAQLIQAGVVTPEQCPEQYPGEEFLRMGALGSMSSKDQIANERLRRPAAAASLTPAHACWTPLTLPCATSAKEEARGVKFFAVSPQRLLSV